MMGSLGVAGVEAVHGIVGGGSGDGWPMTSDLVRLKDTCNRPAYST